MLGGVFLHGVHSHIPITVSVRQEALPNPHMALSLVSSRIGNLQEKGKEIREKRERKGVNTKERDGR